MVRFLKLKTGFNPKNPLATKSADNAADKAESKTKGEKFL